MMQSIAFTESPFFAADEDDFVVVDSVPLLGANSDANSVGDDESYDYCDETPQDVGRDSDCPITNKIFFEDDGSYLSPPSLEDEPGLLDVASSFLNEITENRLEGSNEMSSRIAILDPLLGVSESFQQDIDASLLKIITMDSGATLPVSESEHKSSGLFETENKEKVEIASWINSAEATSTETLENVVQPEKSHAMDADSAIATRRQVVDNHAENSANGADETADSTAPKATFASAVANVEPAEPTSDPFSAWTDEQSYKDSSDGKGKRRMTNKKRRKQLKLARRAAVAAAAAAALAQKSLPAPQSPARSRKVAPAIKRGNKNLAVACAQQTLANYRSEFAQSKAVR